MLNGQTQLQNINYWTENSTLLKNNLIHDLVLDYWIMSIPQGVGMNCFGRSSDQNWPTSIEIV